MGLIHSGYWVLSIYGELNEADMKKTDYVFTESNC